MSSFLVLSVAAASHDTAEWKARTGGAEDRVAETGGRSQNPAGKVGRVTAGGLRLLPALLLMLMLLLSLNVYLASVLLSLPSTTERVFVIWWHLLIHLVLYAHDQWKSCEYIWTKISGSTACRNCKKPVDYKHFLYKGRGPLWTDFRTYIYTCTFNWKCQSSKDLWEKKFFGDWAPHSSMGLWWDYLAVLEGVDCILFL